VWVISLSSVVGRGPARGRSGRDDRAALAADKGNAPALRRIPPPGDGVAGAMQFYLDCDGVLADFDAGAARVLGCPPRAYRQRHGLARFWAALARAPDFYGQLPLMPDAMALFDAVRPLAPIILTGCPRGTWAQPQKERWAARHFPGTRLITCLAVDKSRHCRPGDVLVDDTPTHRHLWEGVGGVFILHRSARASLRALAAHLPGGLPGEGSGAA
jgi:hypothetical protein